MTTDSSDGAAKHGSATRVDAVDFDIFGGDAGPMLTDADDTIVKTIAPGTKLDFDLASEPPTATLAGLPSDDSDMYAEDATMFATGALPPRQAPLSPKPVPAAVPVTPAPAPGASNSTGLMLAAAALAGLAAVVWWFLR